MGYGHVARKLARTLTTNSGGPAPLRFRQAFAAARRPVSPFDSALQRLHRDPAALSESELGQSLAFLCKRQRLRFPSESLRVLNEHLCTYRIHHVESFLYALEYAVIYEQLDIMSNILEQLPDLLKKARPSTYVGIVGIIARHQDAIPQQSFAFVLDHIAGSIQISRLTSSEMIGLFAAMSRFALPHHGLVLAINRDANAIVSKLSLGEMRLLLTYAFTDFNKDSSLIQGISNKVSLVLANSDRLDQESVHDIISIFIQFARNSLFNPELGKAALELFPKFASHMAIVDLIRLAESVSRCQLDVVKVPESISHPSSMNDLHCRLLDIIMPKVPSLSFRSLSMLLSSLHKPRTEETLKSLIAICDTIAQIPAKINPEFIGAFSNSISISRVYHPKSLNRLCSEMMHAIQKQTVSEESFSRTLFGMAMLRHPLSRECHAVFADYASILTGQTSDPNTLIRVFWSLAVYDQINDPELALQSILRLENMFTSKHLSYCHDILHHMTPSLKRDVLDSVEFKTILLNSRRIRSRLYPTPAEFKSKCCEALDAAGIPYVRNCRVCQSGYRFDIVLEQMKSVIALDNKECFVRNDSHLTGAEFISRQFLRNSSWSVIQVPYWVWSKFDVDRQNILRLISDNWLSSA